MYRDECRLLYGFLGSRYKADEYTQKNRLAKHDLWKENLRFFGRHSQCSNLVKYEINIANDKQSHIVPHSTS